MEKIIALFKNETDTNRVVEALKEAGFSDDAFTLGDPAIVDEEEVVMDIDNDGEDDQVIMLTVQSENTQTEIAKTILKNGGALQVNDMEGEWRSSTWVGYVTIPKVQPQ